MMQKIYLFLAIILAMPAVVMAQLPTVAPSAEVIAPEDAVGEIASEPYQMAVTVRFEANPTELDWTPRYEWRISMQGEPSPRVVRNDASIEYTFDETGTWEVELYVTFVRGGETVVYEAEDPNKEYPDGTIYAGTTMDEPFSITLTESTLEFPNAFSPNGDGINDYLSPKPSKTRGLVEFEASVFNRWGKHIYSWTDWQHKESGWDGTDHGRPCPDGAYYLNVKAKGADGRKYHLKKTITLLTGYREETE